MTFTQSRESKTLFSRLALKIIGAISICVLVIQLLFIGYIENSIYQSELKTVANQQVIFTEASSMYIAELAAEDNEDSLYLILSSIVANPLVVGATITYTDDKDPLYIGTDPTELVYSFEIKDLDDNDDLITIATLTTFATTEYIDKVRSCRQRMNQSSSKSIGLTFEVFPLLLQVSSFPIL